MELFRCLLFLIVDLVLSSQNLDTGGKQQYRIFAVTHFKGRELFGPRIIIDSYFKCLA